MDKTQGELIQEEQRVLNNLIKDMDDALLQLDKRLTYNDIKAHKAKASCLPEAYGTLISAEQGKLDTRQQIKHLRNGKDELYETRLILDVTDEKGKVREDIKVGLHSYCSPGRVFIMSWKMPLCRHYILDNSSEIFDGIVIGPHGEEYNAHYQLQLKRKVNILFDKVKNVTQLFQAFGFETPRTSSIEQKTERKQSNQTNIKKPDKTKTDRRKKQTDKTNQEKIIADDFLLELLNRRSGMEFKNIVFSIQRRQGQIIQTPLKQNLIVQGCAGSGKSMIMLHRLPIVIYDNPNSLSRSNLYIITPSLTYIQMVNNMRYDLEIDDLKMGTLEQYYNYILLKYQLKPEIYGTIKPYIKLGADDLKYIYSPKCVDDIRKMINEIIKVGTVDYDDCYSQLNINKTIEIRPATIPSEYIRKEIVKMQTILNTNDSNLKSYHIYLYNLYAQYDELSRMLRSRKTAVMTSIKEKISSEEKTIKEKKEEIKRLGYNGAHEVMFQNRINSIEAAKNKIESLLEVKNQVENDEEYFEYLEQESDKIQQVLSLFKTAHNDRSKISLEEQYQLLEQRKFLCAACNELLEEILRIDDPYWKYVESIISEIHKIEPFLQRLIEDKSQYLSLELLQKLNASKEYYSDIAENTVQKVYLYFMKKLGQEPDAKGRVDALECSQYLYLQILYLFAGAPNGGRESLITIDEAQNIAPEELRLIRAVNGNNVVLNLFGDPYQHVEGTKGLDNWGEIPDYSKFKIEIMRENYRNARQITEFCNKRFKMDMRAINLDGRGVHELKNSDDFENTIKAIFQKPQNVGLSCIIVKNKEEADTLISTVNMYSGRIHNMTRGIVELNNNKWNLMTSEQAKGLEFETVFAVSGRMSRNEKYITYTRALDELYIYDKEIDLIEANEYEKPSENSETKEKVESTREKRKKRSSKETNAHDNEKGLKKFFEEKNLKVIDNRKKSGHLWVLGSKAEIDSIVNEAMEIYGITGSYGSGKASGFKTGWFTKSKK